MPAFETLPATVHASPKQYVAHAVPIMHQAAIVSLLDCFEKLREAAQQPTSLGRPCNASINAFGSNIRNIHINLWALSLPVTSTTLRYVSAMPIRGAASSMRRQALLQGGSNATSTTRKGHSPHHVCQ